MKNYLKQSMVWATALRRNVQKNMFERARIKLTTFYLVGMIVILGIFTGVLVVTLEKNIRDTYRENIGEGESFDRAILETNDGIEAIIYTVDGLLIIILGAASYILAGRTLRPIKESLEAQKRFSADASHDLRTPLSIIMTESEVVLASESAEASDYQSTIKSVLEEAHVMSHLVEDLLFIARSENASSYEEKDTVLLSDLIDPLVLRTQKQGAQKNISVSQAPIPQISIHVNTHLFTRALQNIFQNAINYTPQGGAITVSARKDHKQIVLSIADTGVGIDEEDLPHVFDRFYKAAHSRNDGSGSGLGLPIAKEIIEQHNGTIEITSVLKKGTTVEISLPIVS